MNCHGVGIRSLIEKPHHQLTVSVWVLGLSHGETTSPVNSRGVGIRFLMEKPHHQ